MKRQITLLFTCLILAFNYGNAQVNVVVNIQHLMGNQPFALGTSVTNNLGHDYKFDRLQYYITKFIIVHDGGVETGISADTMAFVDAAVEATTTIELGSVSVTNIEGIKFHIGVHPEVNNEDPSLWDYDHPLGPKIPSMHWGWTSGYRFLAYEGVGGTDYSQIFQFHGLGNENYFTTTVAATGVMVGSEMHVNISADYIEGVRDIAVNDGSVSHGTTGDALLTLKNFQDHVFGTEVLGNQIIENLTWTIYPNPTNDGIVNVNLGNLPNGVKLQITNLLGQEITITSVTEHGVTRIELPETGVYMLNAIIDDRILSTVKLISK